MRFSAQIWSTRIARGKNLEDSLFDCLSCFPFAQMLQHHRTRPDLRRGVRDVFPSNVWSRPMDWLEERRKFFLRIDVAGWCQTHRSHDGSAQVRQNIAEQVGCDDD